MFGDTPGRPQPGVEPGVPKTAAAEEEIFPVSSRGPAGAVGMVARGA